MKIITMVAENYKKLRVAEITPDGNVVLVTGKNSQGKSSVLDAIWTGLVGKRATPDKPVRKGASKAIIQLGLGKDRVEVIVTRTIAPDGAQTLVVEKGRGNRITSPQALLDELLGELSFDPLAFVSMKPKEQVELLRKVAKIDIDVDQMNADSAADFQARTHVNREIKTLESQLQTLVVQPGLPAEKIDDAAIISRINQAGAENKRIEEQRSQRNKITNDVDAGESAAVAQSEKIERLKAELEGAIALLGSMESGVAEMKKTLATMPYPEPVDVSDLTAELSRARIVNAAIDTKNKHDEIETQLRAKERESQHLTRAIEDREEKKAAAVANAKMPIDDLSFDDANVLYRGVPLEQLGEAEQIQIGTRIAMAANPTLRILRILHGEALDDDSLKVITDLAVANDYQLWIAKVDSSGKLGIVMEDGAVKKSE